MTFLRMPTTKATGQDVANKLWETDGAALIAPPAPAAAEAGLSLFFEDLIIDSALPVVRVEITPTKKQGKLSATDDLLTALQCEV